jgi:hypothetical protein
VTATDLENLKALLTAGKFNPDKTTQDYAFQRGWNEAIDWAVTQSGKMVVEEKAT